MEWIALVAFSYLVFRFIITLINLLYCPLIKKEKSLLSELVSVCIPVRNEEQNIPNLLNDLLLQDYTAIEIIMYDDMSEDATWQILEKYKNLHKNIKIIKGKGLPAGWMGKNNACHMMSCHATGNYLLFIDADVRLKKHAVSSVIHTMKNSKLELLSVFPKQVMKSFGEKMVVPLMNQILLSLLIMPLVPRRNYASISAANGQFMLFKLDTYNQFKFHRNNALNPVEDISIARQMKKLGLKTGVYLGGLSISCRMYASFYDAADGFRKNILSFFGNSYFFAITHVLFTTFGALLCYLSFSINICILYLLLLLLQRLMVATMSRFSALEYLFYTIPQHFSFIYVILIAIIGKKNGSIFWKNRTYKI